MSKKAKDIITIIDEMAGLSQLIYVDSNCTGLVYEILKISPSTKAYDISRLTGKPNSTDDEIHRALLKVKTQLLIFVTKNYDHFDIRKFRSEANYYLICVTKEDSFNDILARHLVDACRYDPELKSIRSQDDTYPSIYTDYKYLRKIKRLKK